MKKNILALAICLCGVLLFASCANSNESEEKEVKEQTKAEQSESDLIVFAAASMTESLNELKDEFEKDNPDIKLSYNFDSSGTLKTQIEEGADCDVFISAAKKQMDELEGLDEGKESLIDSESRFDLLENEVTLAVKEDSDKDISSFEDLNTDKVTSIALGNSDVPVGQYSEELLNNLGIWEAIQDKVTFGSNVKEVTTWVSEGAVDCGIIYSTDANTAGLKIVDKADSSKFENRIIYPAALTINSKNKEVGEKFLEFLKSDQAQKVFEKYGFKKVM
ncbi:molybdate ABC transporter substrate-binding protein [Anaerococcus sp. Marseille-Q7828]|uniref:molybdate ABC transporter substrate-binding protein n=1 Tax=Anaerococcus sp. Marseille-Q7828 TaxID=3036300 RepID=UPI0024ACB283|nr:molybdate ABC transporter substrate-binding protein [Anaerococcus sp. Marseille-Q7828]